jgi:hypothetical protein
MAHADDLALTRDDDDATVLAEEMTLTVTVTTTRKVGKPAKAWQAQHTERLPGMIYL